jgi:biotin carboxylase
MTALATRGRVLLLMRTRTYRAKAFLRAAKALGLDVTVATEREMPLQARGSMLALDFGDPRRARASVQRFAEEFPIQAVVGVDDDTTVLAAQIAGVLALPHNSIDSVKAARYKDVMRLALSEAGLLSPPFWVFSLEDDEPARAAAQVSYPCVLKPLSLSASRGVIRADDLGAFVAAWRTIADILGQADLAHDDPGRTQVLVESFIPGAEVAVEGMLADGRLRVLALFDKPDPLDGPFFEETIYVTPSRLGDDTQAAIADSVQRACDALALRSGPVHAEARVNDTGVWIVEVAARSIGGLCSSTLRFESASGSRMALEEIILAEALDLAGAEDRVARREQRPAGVMMIPVPAEGILREVSGLAEAQAVTGIDSIEISIPCGERVLRPPRASRYLGFIFAHADSPADVESALRAAHARLHFEIEPARE